MCEENIGGVTFADVVRFQLKIMMGSQYDRVINADEEKDIVVACLRVAWNDAFCHVTKNQPEEKIKELLKQKNKSLDDYICEEILIKDDFLKVFIDYANAVTSEAKVGIINKAIDDKFLYKFAGLKVIDDKERKLCFGHIQKLFNMAIKYYLCLYFCKDYLDKEECFFQTIEKDALENADCPIDSVILKELGMNSNIKWSKIGLDNDTKKYIEA